MMTHTKVYLNHFGYNASSFIACESCGAKAVDIHHITPRSLLGKDEINNLIALCRDCHDEAHGSDSKEFKIQLQQIISKR